MCVIWVFISLNENIYNRYLRILVKILINLKLRWDYDNI